MIDSDGPSESTHTWHLRHPPIPILAKELPLWRQLHRLIQRTIHDIHKIAGVSTILQNPTATIGAKLPVEQRPGAVVGFVDFCLTLCDLEGGFRDFAG